jgi:radical SAM protein with 4Fe4S-binding SPASM domain
MRAIKAVTERFQDRGLDLTHIRFPNDDKPLSGCDIGKLIYVFADGQLAVCPYIVFAARTPQSKYPDTEFLVGNIFDDEVGPVLDAYDFHARFTVGSNLKCGTCGINAQCGKGCPAAIISRGGYIGDVDSEQCAMPNGRPLLQIGRRAP